MKNNFNRTADKSAVRFFIPVYNIKTASEFLPKPLLYLILILNQPIDKSSARISPFIIRLPYKATLPCQAASLPAVAFLDWTYSICRLCLQND